MSACAAHTTASCSPLPSGKSIFKYPQEWIKAIGLARAQLQGRDKDSAAGSTDAQYNATAKVRRWPCAELGSCAW